MAIKPRLEVEGGLYHVIVRGNDRQDIFHSREDHLKLISLIEKAKQNLGFYLYAYCLMTNHLHLLIERRTDDIGRPTPGSKCHRSGEAYRSGRRLRQPTPRRGRSPVKG